MTSFKASTSRPNSSFLNVKANVDSCKFSFDSFAVFNSLANFKLFFSKVVRAVITPSRSTCKSSVACLFAAVATFNASVAVSFSAFKFKIAFSFVSLVAVKSVTIRELSSFKLSNSSFNSSFFNIQAFVDFFKFSFSVCNSLVKCKLFFSKFVRAVIKLFSNVFQFFFAFSNSSDNSVCATSATSQVSVTSSKLAFKFL